MVSRLISWSSNPDWGATLFCSLKTPGLAPPAGQLPLFSGSYPAWGLGSLSEKVELQLPDSASIGQRAAGRFGAREVGPDLVHEQRSRVLHPPKHRFALHRFRDRLKLIYVNQPGP
jgi:hypothetical protein